MPTRTASLPDGPGQIEHVSMVTPWGSPVSALSAHDLSGPSAGAGREQAKVHYVRGATRHVLITGLPGCGKTTLVRNLARRLKEEGVPLFGFWTEEIRDRGRRVGFAIELVGGQKGTLAHENFPSGPRVSRYKVDVSGFEALAVPEMERAIQAASRQPAVLIVDEVGKMELHSQWFKEVLLKALDSSLTVVATILRAPNAFTDQVKARPDARLVTISASNRERVGEEILQTLSRSAGPRKDCAAREVNNVSRA